MDTSVLHSLVRGFSGARLDGKARGRAAARESPRGGGGGGGGGDSDSDDSAGSSRRSAPAQAWVAKWEFFWGV
jgi:hypothetical protein